MTFYTSLFCSAALSLAFVAPVAFAQTSTEAAEDEAFVQDTVLVTGNVLYSDQINALKTPTPIIDVPQSLSIITADQIADRGFDSVGDIINYTAGVNNSQGEGHRDAVVFRGIRSTAAFFVDGVRDDVQYYRPLYNIEQVEILRGPNALLFGRGGTGGILNRVTKKALLGEQFTGYRGALDTFGGFEASIDSNLSISDTAGVRINAYYESLENHRDFFDGDNYGINPTARFALTPQTVLDVSLEYIDQEQFVDRGIPTGSDGRPVEAFQDIVFGDPDLNMTTHEATVLRAQLQHEFSDSFKGVVSASYGDYDKAYTNFYASGYDQALNPGFVTLDGYVDTTQRENFILSGNIVGEFATGPIGHTLIVGAEFIDTTNDNDRFNTRWSTNGFTDDNEIFAIQGPLDLRGGTGTGFNNFVDPVTGIISGAGEVTTNDFSLNLNDRTASEVEVYSLFVQDQIELSPMIDIVLGGRFDSFDQSTVNLAIPGSAAVSRTDEKFSPRAGLIFKPQENISFYAAYSETFLPRSGEQFASTGSLDPDEFENAEIGVKWDIYPGLSFTTAYFQNEETRAARDDVTGEDFEVRGTEIEGFELQLQGQITEQLFLTAGYSYLEGETDNGAEIPRELPENMFSIWGAYQVTDKFGLGLGATYQDESFITDFDIGDDASTHPTLPSYTRIDAAAYYDVSDTLRLQFNIENLTDELYFPTAHSTHQATVGAPLNAKFTISGRF
ncbi:MAG: TonB-dependent siderophore receptor [Henriciella sp.]